MKLEERARQFAVQAHGDQKYGDYNYEYHLRKTRDALRDIGLIKSPTVLAASWLHDTLEDTDVGFKILFEEFGKTIARLVYAVTDEPGKNRRERHERTYPKILAAGREATAIKLADRIANVVHSLGLNHGLFKMYRKEHHAFREKLKIPGELKEMWATLDILIATNIED